MTVFPLPLIIADNMILRILLIPRCDAASLFTDLQV